MSPELVCLVFPAIEPATKTVASVVGGLLAPTIFQMIRAITTMPTIKINPPMIVIAFYLETKPLAVNRIPFRFISATGLGNSRGGGLKIIFSTGLVLCHSIVLSSMTRSPIL